MLLSVIIFFWNTMKGLTDPMDYFLIDTPKLLLKKTNISWTTPSVVFNSFTQLHWKIFTRDPTIILFFQRGWRDSPDQRGVGSNPEDKNLPGLSLRSWDFNSYFRIYFHLLFSFLSYSPSYKASSLRNEEWYLWTVIVVRLAPRRPRRLFLPEGLCGQYQEGFWRYKHSLKQGVCETCSCKK